MFNKASEKQRSVEQLLAGVPSVQDDPRLAAAGKLRDGLQAEEKHLVRLLATTNDYGSPPPRFDSSADAAKLLDGALLESLTVEPGESEPRNTILRQLRAVQAARPVAEDRVRMMELQIQQDLLAGPAADVLRAEYAEVLAAFEVLLARLRVHHNVLTGLSQRGIHGLVMGAWALTPLENQLVFGGNSNPSLEWYIDARRKALGIEERK